MTKLRSCYFCGVDDDSLQEYDLSPASTDRHSAVLCSTCHGKLRRVLEPLLDGGREAPPDAGGPDDTASTPEVTFESDADATGSTAADESGSAASASATAADAGVNESTAESATVDEEPDTDADAESAADAEVETTADAPDVPDEYYTVLRLLQNREFPMERADVTTLVTGAYDVSVPECERIVDTAVERGVLVEQGSTLTLGRD